MCSKLNYCARKIDPCIQETVDWINANTDWRTVLSCCGHDHYFRFIVVQHKVTNNCFDWFSGVLLRCYNSRTKKGERFYVRDGEGYYFLPEVLKHIRETQPWRLSQ